MENENQYRKTPRANWISYNAGTFFVTICTKDMVHYFGHIANGEMMYSAVGEFVCNELKNASAHHPHIDVPLFVVMPNHLHAIVFVNEPKGEYHVPTPEDRAFNYLPHKQRPLLSSFVGSMKSAVTRFANRLGSPFAWQPRFHDHLIRDNNQLNKIADYINYNVSCWMKDKYYSEK